MVICILSMIAVTFIAIALMNELISSTVHMERCLTTTKMNAYQLTMFENVAEVAKGVTSHIIHHTLVTTNPNTMVANLTTDILPTHLILHIPIIILLILDPIHVKERKTVISTLSMIAAIFIAIAPMKEHIFSNVHMERCLTTTKTNADQLTMFENVAEVVMGVTDHHIIHHIQPTQLNYRHIHPIQLNNPVIILVLSNQMVNSMN